jgi:Down syndrome cell adhesion protein 1
MSATCSVSVGDYPLEISWFFNDKQLTTINTQDVSISTGKRRSLLEIEAVGAHHAGMYTCSVSNEAGATSRNTVLIVNGNCKADSRITINE